MMHRTLSLVAATLLAQVAPAQDQAPTRTTAAPKIRAVDSAPAQPSASPQAAAATQRCVATNDAADRSQTCAQLSRSNPAIVDPNPVVPPRPAPRRRPPR